MKYLLLWLEGPLQSWGSESRFDRKDTGFFPTRSAVTGMLLSAMGKKGEQQEFLRLLAETKMSPVLCFRRKDSRDISIVQDLHMVGNGYSDKDDWEKLCMPKKLDGTKPQNRPSTRRTYRYYLVDVAFAVIWEVLDDMIEEVTAAFICPKYDVYLGRKACVPSEFVFQGVYDCVEAAKDRAVQICEDKNYVFEREIIEGKAPESDDVVMLYDIPVSFGKFKKYKPRYVSIFRIG